MTRQAYRLGLMQLVTRLLLPTLVTVSLCLPASAALMIDVNVKVQGFSGTVKIGAIDVDSGPAPNTDKLQARFAFQDPFKGSILDGWYDFQWINVVDSKTGADSPLFGKYPAIDPQAPPKNANEDDEPYYYHQIKEWDPGVFKTAEYGDIDIRDDGDFSLFFDSPQRGKGDGFKFNTFLVAQDITAGDFSGKKFSVLAGFDWTYTGGTKGNAGEDISTVGTAITVDQAALDRIKTAMGNEANNKFAGWTALAPQTLKPCPIPEPASITLFALGTIGIVGCSWRRKQAA